MSRYTGTEDLQRGLKERHIQMMAIGGAIGTGLFLGSGATIKAAGPSILFVYAVTGIMILFIMRALGELAVEHPVAGSFSAYANNYINPLAGYLTGWTYWFMWEATCMADITATGIYVNYWFPNVPPWVTALVIVALLAIVNLTAVGAFGEFEFWFAMIKVVTIIALIVIGLLMVIFGVGHGGAPLGISNLWTHGGLFPNGITGSVMALVMVTFAFVGVELIGVTAGEAENPDKVIPSAINKVFYRVLIFYIGALFVIMSIYPWNEIGTKGSPFVLTFESLGITAAAGIINFVVLTASTSAANSGIFTTGRMLYNLAQQGQAPRSLGKLSARHVPRNGILVSVVFMLVGVLLNYVVPAKVFTYVTSIAAFAGLFSWGAIIVAQMGFRKQRSPEQVKNLKFPMLMYPLSSYIVFAFLAFVYVVMWLNPDTLVAAIIGPIWLLILVAAFYAAGLNKKKLIFDNFKTTQAAQDTEDSRNVV